MSDQLQHIHTALITATEADLLTRQSLYGDAALLEKFHKNIASANEAIITAAKDCSFETHVEIDDPSNQGLVILMRDALEAAGYRVDDSGDDYMTVCWGPE